MNIAWGVLKLLGPFNQKLLFFTKGRKNVLEQLQNSIKSGEKTIWMHVASLGEFEQGLPILEAINSKHKEYKIVLTFFSPSGYEVKKTSAVADFVCYLPIDTATNAKTFLNIVNPTLAIFVKYEIWPNYLHYLKKNNTPTFLVSAIFRKQQLFFKWYGGFMRNALTAFSHFFVQNEISSTLLRQAGFDSISISGDTRFDRVAKILDEGISLQFMETFKGNELCFVAGSTWPQDDAILIDYINTAQSKVKFVIAPHNIKPRHIQDLRGSIQKETILYSEFEEQGIKNADVLIIDTIGLLTKIYSYADIAYVGGGFTTGLHNTLEPAVFGIPVLIGPQYDGFQEVEDLTSLGGILVIADSDEFTAQMNILLGYLNKRESIGEINTKYVQQKTGATTKIVNHIEGYL